jgi:hypothetical protein
MKIFPARQKMPHIRNSGIIPHVAQKVAKHLQAASCYSCLNYSLVYHPRTVKEPV